MSHTIYPANGKGSYIHRRMCEWDYTIDKSLVCLKKRKKDVMLEYLIKFVSDLRQVGGFLRVLRIPLPIKLTAKI
jgi:hypothetical protein